METLTFNGRKSSDYGIHVEKIPTHMIPERDYERVHVSGRNGDVIVDTKSWKNAELKYEVSLGDDTTKFEDLSAAIFSWLHPNAGYVRLESSDNPQSYRLASLSDSIDIEPVNEHGAKTEISFDCKPQNYLKMGENAEAFEWNSGKLTNVTPKLTTIKASYSAQRLYVGGRNLQGAGYILQPPETASSGSFIPFCELYINDNGRYGVNVIDAFMNRSATILVLWSSNGVYLFDIRDTSTSKKTAYAKLHYKDTDTAYDPERIKDVALVDDELIISDSADNRVYRYYVSENGCYYQGALTYEIDIFPEKFYVPSGKIKTDIYQSMLYCSIGVSAVIFKKNGGSFEQIDYFEPTSMPWSSSVTLDFLEDTGWTYADMAFDPGHDIVYILYNNLDPDSGYEPYIAVRHTNSHEFSEAIFGDIGTTGLMLDVSSISGDSYFLYYTDTDNMHVYKFNADTAEPYDPIHFEVWSVPNDQKVCVLLDSSQSILKYSENTIAGFTKEGAPYEVSLVVLPGLYWNDAFLSNPTGMPSYPLLWVQTNSIISIIFKRNGVTTGTIRVNGASEASGFAGYIDCETADAYGTNGENLNNRIDFVDNKIPELEEGVTTIECATGPATIDIIPRWWTL